MKAFHDNYNLTSLINQPTCYEKPNNPTCIDLILSNTSSSFQSTCATETRYYQVLFNELTVMKKSFRKFQLWLKNHRSYKNFSKDIFVNNDDELQRFCDIKLQLLNQHVPQKIKYVWGNQMPFHDKATFWRNEEIRLRSNFMGNRTEKK